jgi:hypothetical protein
MEEHCSCSGLSSNRAIEDPLFLIHNTLNMRREGFVISLTAASRMLCYFDILAGSVQRNSTRGCCRDRVQLLMYSKSKLSCIRGRLFKSK